MRFSRMIAVALICGSGITGLAQGQDAEDRYGDARRALNRRQFDEAVSAFQALRRDYPDSRNVGDSYYWEAFALERNGNLERAVQVIDTLLREHPDAPTIDDSRALRIRICSELARRGNGECAEAISSTVRDANQLDEATRMAAVNALINMRADRAVPIAMQLLANRNQPVEVRKHALFIIADKADETNVAAQAREALLSAALDQTDNLELRTQAVFWLSEVPGEETLDALSGLANGSGDFELRNKAIFAISQHDSPRAMGVLRELAENDAFDVELRKQAVFWIGEEGEGQSLPFLTELYGKLTNPELKRQILFAVAQTEADGSTDWLIARARDAGEAIEARKQALFWAADAGLPLAELRSLYGTLTEPELRQHLIWLIAERDDEASFDVLVEIARNDPDQQMRRKAIFWLGDSADPRAAEYVLQLLEQ